MASGSINLGPSFGGGGGGGGSVNSVTASSPVLSSGGANPNISFSGAISTSDFSLKDSSDATKLFNWNLSGQSTGVSTTISPLGTANTVFQIQPMVDATANIITQNATSGQIFIGANTSLGGANSGLQYSNATTANRGQIRLGSYVNATSVAGVTTATSRSGVVGTNAAVVAGQDYSKWTAQAGATTPGSLPISGAFAFKANTVNSLTVTTDYHIQLTNLAGTIGDRLYLSSEGLLQLPGYTAGFSKFDSSGNITSAAIVSTDVGYTPGIPANWTSPPTTVQQALDQIAAKIGPI